jgi:hypothetical protein
MFGDKNLNFSELLNLSGKGQYIGVRNTAGFANQTRCVLGVLATGNIPVLIRDDLYLSGINKSHKCDLSKIYKALEISDKKKKLSIYSDITLPPPEFADHKEHLFNLLNMWGMINSSSLAFYKNELSCYRKYFLSLEPVLKLNEITPCEISDGIVMHIRDFAKETGGWRIDSSMFKEIRTAPFRHIQKVDMWTFAREEHLIFSIKNLASHEIKEVQIVASEISIDLLNRIRTRFHNDKIATSLRQSSSAYPELEDVLIMSNSKYLVLTSLSTFGHLGALLNEKLLACITI